MLLFELIGRGFQSPGRSEVLVFYFILCPWLARGVGLVEGQMTTEHCTFLWTLQILQCQLWICGGLIDRRTQMVIYDMAEKNLGCVHCDDSFERMFSGSTSNNYVLIRPAHGAPMRLEQVQKLVGGPSLSTPRVATRLLSHFQLITPKHWQDQSYN